MPLADDLQSKRNRHAFIAISAVVLLVFTTRLIVSRSPPSDFTITVNEPKASVPAKPERYIQAAGHMERGVKLYAPLGGQMTYLFTVLDPFFTDDLMLVQYPDGSTDRKSRREFIVLRDTFVENPAYR